MTDRPDRPVALERRAHDSEGDGALLFSPSAARNAALIAEALAPRLPEGAHVLELGSGTGEHAEHVCARRPDLRWTPSDPDPASRASCAARAARSGGAMAPPRDLDLTRPDWAANAPYCDAVFCANTIHIAPWSAAQGLAAGAALLLAPGGLLILYGPFLEGADSAPSNLRFDADLRARDPRWGVRERAEVESLFAGSGLSPREAIPMPANNRILVFARA